MPSLFSSFFLSLAHHVLHSLNLEIHVSDQSDVFSCHLSLSHFASLFPSSPHSSIIHYYQGTPHAFLHAWGTWSHLPIFNDFLPPSFVPSNVNPFSFPSLQFYNFRVIASWLLSLWMDSLISRPSSLVIPLPLCQKIAENSIIAASCLDELVNPPNHMPSQQWATNGSLIDSAQSVSSVLVGPQPVALRIAGSNASSIQGEVLALISASLIIASWGDSDSHIVHSDHLQSIQLIDDI